MLSTLVNSCAAVWTLAEGFLGVFVYLGPTAPSESWLPVSLGVSADLGAGVMGGGATLETETEYGQ